MESLKAGDPVRVRDAAGEVLDRIAATGVVAGRTFDVVWLARPEEWRAAEDDGRDPIITPWPAEDVRPVVSVAQ